MSTDSHQQTKGKTHTALLNLAGLLLLGVAGFATGLTVSDRLDDQDQQNAQANGVRREIFRPAPDVVFDPDSVFLVPMYQPAPVPEV